MEKNVTYCSKEIKNKYFKNQIKSYYLILKIELML